MLFSLFESLILACKQPDRASPITQGLGPPEFQKFERNSDRPQFEGFLGFCWTEFGFKFGMNVITSAFEG
jgi:hypothetical protein